MKRDMKLKMKKQKKNKNDIETDNLYSLLLKSTMNKIFFSLAFVFCSTSTMCFFSRYTQNNSLFWWPFWWAVVSFLGLCICCPYLLYGRAANQQKNQNKKKAMAKKRGPEPVETLVDSYAFNEDKINKIFSEEDWSKSSGGVSGETKRWLDEL